MTAREGAGAGRRLASSVGRAPAGRPRSALASGVALAAAVALVLLMAGTALAASPSPTTAAGGDPRSSGQGPGLVGDPLAAIAIVAVVALVSLAATLLYIRLTGGPGNARPGGTRPER